MFDGPLAIFGVDSADPIPIGFVSRLEWQPVNEEVFGGAAVLDAVAEIDFEAADTGHSLDSCKLRLAFLQRAMGSIPLARDLFQMLPQPLGCDCLGEDIRGIGRCHGACNPAPL